MEKNPCLVILPKDYFIRSEMGGDRDIHIPNEKTTDNMETENIEQSERSLFNVDYTIKELAKIHDEVLEKMMIEINRIKFGGNEKIHIQS